MKKLISAGLSLALCLALCVPAFAAGTFTDVSGWAAPYIERAASLGLINGVGDGRYAPDNQVSYREYAVMVCNIRYKEEAEKAAAENSGAWWEPYCAVANAHGLWDSTAMAKEGAWDSQNSRPVSRQDMAQVMYNCLQAERKQQPSQMDKAGYRPQISDLDSVNARNEEAVVTCYAMKLLSGTDKGFAPTATMSRAQAAVALCSLYDAVTGGADREVQTNPRLANGKEITEDNVREIINGLRSSYPEGTAWTNESNTYTSYPLYIKGYGCAAYAFLFSDKVFGELPLVACHSNFDKIRAGDILRTRNDEHTVIVLEKRDDSVIVTEGNYGGKVHWDREITRQDLEEQNFFARTRYPSYPG